MEKTYTTKQAAKKIGVHFITLHKMLKAGRIKAHGIKLPNGKTFWLWTSADIAAAKKEKKPKGRPREEGNE